MMSAIFALTFLSYAIFGVKLFSKMSHTYAQYVEYTQKIADIQFASALLDWDQEIYLPAKGAAARSRQLATLGETAQHWLTDKKYGEMLQHLVENNSLSATERANVRISLEEYNRQQKRSPAFVRRLSEAVSAAYHAWVEARKRNNFKNYAPALDKVITLKKEEAELVGYEKSPYNALLSEYERSASVEMLDDLFLSITQPLQDLLSKVEKAKVDDHFLHLHYAENKQLDWGNYLIRQMGLDMDAARLDLSEHPFTTNFSAKDVRITTRIDLQDVSNNTWSCIHECGHALYEQGLPDTQYGLPAGMYASLSIHESQSRFWENCAGRGNAFWQYYFPKMQEFFPTQLKTVSFEKFYKGINKVQPSLIRTESDELTYHFHIKIRYQVEKEMIEGKIKTTDVAARWNELYKENLGVDVPDDKTGCLQDIHWSIGSIGYFPTYSLGSFYAAQFWAQLKKEQPHIESEIAHGNLNAVLQWLRENIHQYGRLYTSEELCKKVTGKGLDATAFIAYLTEKLDSVYTAK